MLLFGDTIGASYVHIIKHGSTLIKSLKLK